MIDEKKVHPVEYEMEIHFNKDGVVVNFTGEVVKFTGEQPVRPRHIRIVKRRHQLDSRIHKG